MANASFCAICGEMLAPDDYYVDGVLPPEHQHICPAAPPAPAVAITEAMLDRGTNAIYLRMNQSPTAMEKWNELTDGVRAGYRDYARVVLNAALAHEEE